MEFPLGTNDDGAKCKGKMPPLGPLFTRSLRVVFCLGTNDDGTKYKCKMPLLGAPKNLERLRPKIRVFAPEGLLLALLSQLHDRVVRSLGYFSGIFGAQSLLNGIVNGREVARHVTAVLPGVASKNIMSDMQASCWMQTLGSREFPQHALQAIHENALWDPMSKTLATARCDCGA